VQSDWGDICTYMSMMCETVSQTFGECSDWETCIFVDMLVRVVQRVFWADAFICRALRYLFGHNGCGYGRKNTGSLYIHM
jgi:hypothetical protein